MIINGINTIVTDLKNKWEIRSKAKQLDMPIKIKNQYVYAVGSGLNIGHVAYHKWTQLVKNGLAPDNLWPAAISKNTIGLYALVRSYDTRRQGTGFQRPDYAWGDNGTNGDFIIKTFVDITD